MRKLLVVVLVLSLGVGGYYLFRLLPLFTAENRGGEMVVLLHGLGRTEMAMLLLESALADAGYNVHNVGYPSQALPPESLVEIVSSEINRCCANRRETVHFVGHSLGGLLIRAYLGRYQPANLGRVVLLGTPNKGSELADVRHDELVSGELPAGSLLANTLLELAGPAARALKTGANGFPAALPAPTYPVGVIAGTRDNPLSNQWLPLPNDGLVTVESTRLEGMTDFLTFAVTHWGLRNDPAVAAQVISFLREGRFTHDTTAIQDAASGDRQVP